VSNEAASGGFARRLLKNALQFAVGSGLVIAASLARAALGARVLLPGEMGIWLGLQLSMSYGGNLHFGTVFGMLRNVPIRLVQGRADEAALEKGTAFSFVVWATILTAPLLYALGRWFLPDALPRHIMGMTLLVVMSLLRSYYVSEFKCESRFAALSLSGVIQALLSFAGLPLIYFYHLDGVIALMALQGLAELATLIPRTRLPPLGIRIDVLRQQLRIGSMTLLITIGTVFLTTIDRTVMLRRCGVAATGLYFVGANVTILLPMVIGIPAAVITPQFMERYGRGEDLMPLVQYPVRATGLVYSAVVALGVVTLDPIVRTLWPHLVGGNAAAMAALFGSYPLVLAGLVSNVYYAHDRQRTHVIVLGIAAAVSLVCAEVGVAITHTITGAAIGAAVGMYVYYVSSLTLAFRLLDRIRAGYELLVQSLWPIAYAVVVVLVANVLGATIGRGHDVLAAPIKIVVTVGAIVPLLFRAKALFTSVLARPKPASTTHGPPFDDDTPA
jgi:O-antigen/teichoic acid export membrane protein